MEDDLPIDCGAPTKEEIPNDIKQTRESPCRVTED